MEAQFTHPVSGFPIAAYAKLEGRVDARARIDGLQGDVARVMYVRLDPDRAHGHR